MTGALAEIGQDLESLWKPRKRRQPLEWCETNITMDARFSPRPGRFSCEFTPYLKKLHEWYGNESVRQITFVKSAQIGGTTLLANLIQYTIAEDPGPILYVTSTGENAKSWSERELIPRIRSCAALRSLMPDDPDQFKKTEMQFKKCTVKLIGSNSQSNLASRPVRYLFCDEVDKWPDSTATEAPALELAMARTIQYRNISKVILASTPTVETGAIYSQFLAGSQHRLHVVCGSCGMDQWLKFDQVRWSAELNLPTGWDLDGVRESACYQCEGCGDLWTQDMKRGLIEEAAAADRWIVGNASAPSDHRSAHISSMYSPTLSWGDMAVLFLQRENSPGGLHDFRNTYEGLPFENRAASIREENLLELRAPYRLREIPAASCTDEGVPALITLCADPGEKQTHWSVEARNSTGESWVIDYGTVLSVEDLLSEEFLKSRVYPLPDGTMVTPQTGLIDSGFLTERVYSVCGRSDGKYWPSKGSESTFGSFGVTQIRGANLLLYTYGDFTWKTHLYLDRIKKKLPPLWWMPEDVGRDFLEGHSGQALIENRNSRLNPYVWKKVAGDHWGDCSKLHGVAWAIARQQLGQSH